MKTLLTTLLLTLALLTLPTPAPAQWTNDPWNGMAVVTAQTGDDIAPQIVRLSSGYYLIIWLRLNEVRIKYQILNNQGVALLEPSGLYLINGSWTNGYERFLLSDGEGGAMAVFDDERNGSREVYGQRFDSLGNRLWGETGLPLLLSPGTQDVSPKDVVADSIGNFFISSVVNSDIYIQKFQADGSLLWGQYGAAVCTGQPYTQEFQESVPDMAGGVIDVWRDSRFGVEELDFFAQHLDAVGNPLWPLNGIQLFNPQSGDPLNGFLGGGVPDGSGGGVWSYDTYWNWFLFRLSGAGQMLWQYGFYLPDTCYVGAPLRHPADGMIWLSAKEKRPGQPWNSYLYRFNLNGHPLFGNAGLPFGGYLTPTSDGVISLAVEEQGNLKSLQATRVDSTGAVAWNAHVNNCRESITPSAYNNPMGVNDGIDGQVCAWEDHRDWDQDVYAQRVQADGTLGNPMPPYPFRPDYPNYQLSLIGHTIRLTLHEAGFIELALYNLLGQKVRQLLQESRPAGVFDFSLDEEGLPAGIYFLNLKMSQSQQTLKIAIIK